MKPGHPLDNLDRAPFAAVLAVLAIVTGARALIDPAVYPVHALMHGWDAVWGAVFLLGGVGLFTGLALARPKLEAAGCALFAGGSLVEAFAYLSFLGWTRVSSWTTVFILVVFALGSIRRYMHLVRGERQAWVR